MFKIPYSLSDVNTDPNARAVLNPNLRKDISDIFRFVCMSTLYVCLCTYKHRKYCSIFRPLHVRPVAIQHQV